MTVVLYPDYVVYRDSYCTEPQLTFSDSCIKVSGSKTSEPFDFEWGVDDLITLECQRFPKAEFVMIKLRVISKDAPQEDTADGVSGFEELKIAVVEPYWSEKEERIASLNAKYLNAWVLLQDMGVETDEDDSPGQGHHFPNFDEPFEDVVYPKGEADAVSISKRDVDLLQPETFINDTIIDFYIKFNLRKSIGSTFSIVSSSGSWLTLDKDPSSVSDGRAAFQRVRKWTRKVDLFEKDYIFIPVNFNLHWSLIVICHPGEVPRLNDGDSGKSLKVPCILHMDSIKGSHTGLKNLIQSYLWEEWKERKKEASEEMSSKFHNLRFVPLEGILKCFGDASSSQDWERWKLFQCTLSNCANVSPQYALTLGQLYFTSLFDIRITATGKFIRLWPVFAPLSGAVSGRSSCLFQSFQNNQVLQLPVDRKRFVYLHALSHCLFEFLNVRNVKCLNACAYTRVLDLFLQLKVLSARMPYDEINRYWVGTNSDLETNAGTLNAMHNPNFCYQLNPDWFLPSEASLKRTLIQRLIFELLENRCREVSSAASSDEDQAKFPECNEHETGVQSFSGRCGPAIPCQENISNSQAGQGIEITLLSTSSLRSSECVSDAGLEDTENGEHFAFSPTGDSGFQQITGITSQTCGITYTSRTYGAETSYDLGISAQEENGNIDSSPKLSNCASDHSEDLGVMENHPVGEEDLGLSQKEEMDVNNPAMENVTCLTDGLVSAPGNPDASIIECSQDHGKVHYNNGYGGSQDPDKVHEGNGKGSSQDHDKVHDGNGNGGSQDPDKVHDGNENGGSQDHDEVHNGAENEGSRDCDKVHDGNENEGSRDRVKVNDGNENGAPLSSCQENPDIPAYQDSNMVDNRTVSCDDVQMFDDDRMPEPQEQPAAKRLRLTQPLEGEKCVT
ncbi:unnamed protein product [Prunus armeniaca]|uniref:Ubiquitin-like protease family profile domain-containing protein n=1 Tax=Prunus armeniaca TaxID=36596 RepID=A0A6J5XR78_PRUAR|nr:unnamed protein product [Prunus armeniaca]